MEDWNLKVTASIPQEFPLPKPLINYITKKPQNPKVYFKLCKSCKYFYYKNHIILAYSAQNHNYQWGVFAYEAPHQVSDLPSIDHLDKFPCKVWLIRAIKCLKEMDIKDFIPKIYKCGVILLHLEKQKISFTEFLFLSSSVHWIKFRSVRISYDNGDPVMLETILGTLKNIAIFEYIFEQNGILPISAESTKNFVQLTNLKNFKTLSLAEIPEMFDFEAFVTFFKIHKTAEFDLHFSDVSEENKNRINAFIDYLIQTPDAVKFRIFFPGIDREKMRILEDKFYAKSAKKQN